MQDEIKASFRLTLDYLEDEARANNGLTKKQSLRFQFTLSLPFQVITLTSLSHKNVV